MMSILLVVLLLAMCVQGARQLAARRRGCEEELPTDYGMNPARPWERRTRDR